MTTKIERICLVCDNGNPGYYRIGTSQSYGPQAAFAKSGYGTYCKAHADARASELRSAWEARKAAQNEKSRKLNPQSASLKSVRQAEKAAAYAAGAKARLHITGGV